ncbi:hypothetical protein ROHU_026568 [Labeo rohita]|uniref:Uncharacterized protein n=1 Tax=Labeo rohita TaxID=84645 RepID=A0A498MA92_LABRO|nr:hypothetical protein ROHU_026568 [Labeo rohita]
MHPDPVPCSRILLCAACSERQAEEGPPSLPVHLGSLRTSEKSHGETFIFRQKEKACEIKMVKEEGLGDRVKRVFVLRAYRIKTDEALQRVSMRYSPLRNKSTVNERVWLALGFVSDTAPLRHSQRRGYRAESPCTASSNYPRQPLPVQGFPWPSPPAPLTNRSSLQPSDTTAEDCRA